MSLRHQLVIVAVLIIIYTAPVLVTFVYYLFHLRNDVPLDLGSSYLKWFGALSTQSDSQLNLFQKVILPVVAGISALSFSNAKVEAATTAHEINTDFRMWLILFCVTIIGVALVIQVGFSVHSSLDFADPARMDAVGLATHKGISSYISNVMENMGTYMMILLGLKSQQ